MHPMVRIHSGRQNLQAREQLCGKQCVPNFQSKVPRSHHYSRMVRMIIIILMIVMMIIIIMIIIIVIIVIMMIIIIINCFPW